LPFHQISVVLRAEQFSFEKEHHMATVSKLYVYLIKSCAAISLQKATIKSAGFVGDRQFMLVDDKGKMISQRTRSGLALVVPEIRGMSLYINAPNMSQISVALNPEDVDDDEERTVDVWGRVFKTIDQGPEVAEWFRDYLKLDGLCHFVSVTEDRMAQKPVEGGIMTVACHDSSSLHIVSEESVADLAERVAEKMKHAGASGPITQVTPEQFRPNIVIKDCEPYAEECGWPEKEKTKGVAIGGEVLLRFRKLPPRCGMIDIDQKTKERGCGILETLKTYKIPAKEKEPTFGAHFFPMTLGDIAVGQTVVFT
jgi:uncharacterized protein YcbX